MFSRKCGTLAVLILLLMVIGVIMMGNSSYVWASMKFNDTSYLVSRQAVFAFIGVSVMYVVSHISLTEFRKYGKKLFTLCITALVLVLIPGLGIQRNSSRSWFGVGSLLIQPSRFFKITITVYVAGFLVRHYRVRTFKRDLLFPIFLVVFGLDLTLLQSDFRSGTVMVCSVAVMVLTAGLPLSYSVRVGMLEAAGLGGLIISAPYHLIRITPSTDPWKDPLGADFQIIQSLFAISPGGILGVGFNSSMQRYFYLSEPQTDFIFAILVGESGSTGCCILIILFLMMIYQDVKTAKNSSNPYLCYVAIGLISLFAIQVMINLGVVVGLFPVTGITLPSISYGGSLLVVVMGSMGLLTGIANES